jgi:hypothetical protein
MEPEWIRVATGPGFWVIGFVLAGNALIQSCPFYRLSRRTGPRLRMGEGKTREAIRASFIASLGPAFGNFVGMTVLVLALGGAYAFARESAGVGSIMYELIAARAGAEAAGVSLTREGLTPPALLILCAYSVPTFFSGHLRAVRIKTIFSQTCSTPVCPQARSDVSHPADPPPLR